MTELQAIAVASGSATTSIVSADGNTTISIRESRQLDEFAAELRRRVDVPVTLYGGMPPGPPTDGTILVCRPDVLEALLATQGHDPAVCARVLVIDVVRTRALEWAEQLGLAGVVDNSRYSRWQHRRDSESGDGLYGRKDVAQSIGAHWSELSIYQSPRYSLLNLPDVPDLPGLIGAYLVGYARLVL